MRVSVRLCAPLDRQAGVEQFDVDLPEPATGSSVIRWVCDHFGDLLPGEGSMMLIVNQSYALTAIELKDEDQVTIVPRISCCHLLQSG